MTREIRVVSKAEWKSRDLKGVRVGATHSHAFCSPIRTSKSAQREQHWAERFQKKIWVGVYTTVLRRADFTDIQGYDGQSGSDANSKHHPAHNKSPKCCGSCQQERSHKEKSRTNSQRTCAPESVEIDRLNIAPSTAMTLREPIRISVPHSGSPNLSFAMKNAPPLTPTS